MKNLNLTPCMYILVPLSILVGLIFVQASGLKFDHLIDWMKIISIVVTADVIFIGVFIRWGWSREYSLKWLVNIPNLNGTWRGYIQTNWKDSAGNTPGPIPTILTISQTLTHISCVMRTAEMESRSYAEGFVIKPDEQIRRLCYSYESKPSVKLRHRSSPHDGTIRLNITNGNDPKLKGEYWTERETTGSVTLSKLTDELLDELPSDFPPHPVDPTSTRPTANHGGTG